MKLGFSTLGCPGWSLAQIADFAVAQGFDGVELRTHDEGIHLQPAADDATLRRAAQLFSSRKCRVFSLLGYSQFTSEKPDELALNRDKLMRLADMAVVMGAAYVRGFMGRLPQGISHDGIMARAAPYLRAACDYAAARGVTIAVETHDDWCRPGVLAELLRAAGPQLGVVWDICNTSLATGLDVSEQYRGLRGAICYCHVKDAVVAPDGKPAYVPIGEGMCDLRGALAALKRDGRDLFLSFEHEKRWHPELPEPETALPQYISRMRKLLC